jgi:hypothetical protein
VLGNAVSEVAVRLLLLRVMRMKILAIWLMRRVMRRRGLLAVLPVVMTRMKRTISRAAR